MRRFMITLCASVGISASLPMSSIAADLTVTVTGIERIEGEVGCALFASSDGFPMAPERAIRQWQEVSGKTVTCAFEGLGEGTYALAISQDFNGNQKTATNFFGIPLEPWGVSNNARPFMRAPTFEEAQFSITEEDKAVDVAIAE